MRIYDIICEDPGTDDGMAVANLLPILMFLKQRGEDKKLEPKMKTQSLINLVNKAGDNSFNYASLVDAHENNPAVANLIRSFNKDEIILQNSETEEPEEPTEQPSQNPEDTVDGMAKRAMNNRT